MYFGNLQTFGVLIYVFVCQFVFKKYNFQAKLRSSTLAVRNCDHSVALLHSRYQRKNEFNN